MWPSTVSATNWGYTRRNGDFPVVSFYLSCLAGRRFLLLLFVFDRKILLDKSFCLVYNSKAKQAGDRAVLRKGSGEESPNIYSGPFGGWIKNRG